MTAKLCGICQRRPELADSAPSRDRPGRAQPQSGGRDAACSRAVSGGLQRSPCCQRSPRDHYGDCPRCHGHILSWGRGSVSGGLSICPRPQFNCAATRKYVLLNVLQRNKSSVEGLSNTTFRIREEVPLDTICQLLRSYPICYKHIELLGSNLHRTDLLFICLYDVYNVIIYHTCRLVSSGSGPRVWRRMGQVSICESKPSE